MSAQKGWVFWQLKLSSRNLQSLLPKACGKDCTSMQLLLERLYWDQASVLVQLGLLDPKLLPGRPVTGAEQAAKVLDFDSVPSYRAMEDVV